MKDFFSGWTVFFVFGCLFLFLPEARAAAPMNMDLAQDHVSITTGFTGSELSVFGTKQGRGDVVVTLEGPFKDSIVWRKERVFGAWINRSWSKFEDVPVYYDYAVSYSGRDDKILSVKELLVNRIGFNFFRTKADSDGHDQKMVKEFEDAFIRNNQAYSLFPKEPQQVHFIDNNFFRVDFHLPSNIPQGEYTARAFLIRDGKVVHTVKHRMMVAEVGFSADVNSIAHEHSFLYGVLCVFIACVVGWLSNVIVRRS